MVPILPSGAVELTLFREPTQAAPEAGKLSSHFQLEHLCEIV